MLFWQGAKRSQRPDSNTPAPARGQEKELRARATVAAKKRAQPKLAIAVTDFATPARELEPITATDRNLQAGDHAAELELAMEQDDVGAHVKPQAVFGA